MALPTHRRWLDRSQPQTLYMATLLLYINAVFELIALLSYGVGGLGILAPLFVIGQVAAAWGIANEKRLGYYLGVVVAILPVVLIPKYGSGGILNLLFMVALIALLLHRQSRQYQKIWFK
jgi:hypothetical protein